MTATFNINDFLSRSTDAPFADTTLHKVMGALPTLSKDGPWLAGGALRRTLLGQEPESDFDIFFANAEQREAFQQALLESGFRLHRSTEHHSTYRGVAEGSSIEREIQCIHFAYYDNAASVIDSFDFTICQFVFDGEDVTVGDYSCWDLGRKRLAVHRVTYPVATLRRLLKYTTQGFTACNGALATILRETATNPELLTHLDIAYVD